MKYNAMRFDLLVCLVLWLMLAPAALVQADEDSDEPSNSAAYTKALKAVEQKDYPAAVGLLTEEVAKNERNADAFNMLGYSHRKMGDLDLAVNFYLKALAIDPKHRGAHEYIGEAYLKKDDLEKAKAHLAKLDDICWLGCEQYDDLKEAVKRYEAGKRS
jgi:tetratricopeptide (TPR) repeat protein